MPPIVTAEAPPILSSSQAAVMILRAAQAGGLPMPNQVEHIVLSESESNLTFYVEDRDDLSVWATWLDEPVAISDTVLPSGAEHHSVDGAMFDHPLRAVCMVKASA